MCIFCKIINNELPSYKVYEDDKTLAFLDIKPTSLGHILVVSKIHYANLEEIAEEDLSALILTVKKLGAKLKNKLGVSGYNIIVNNDPVSGQEIPHIHFHLIPRSKEDSFSSWPKISYAPGEADKILKQLIS